MSAESIAYYERRIADLEALLRHMPVDALLRAQKAAAAQAEEDAQAAAQSGGAEARRQNPIVPDRVDWHAETQEPHS